MKYIVVQAGGKGTRLKHLTRNKPKALVPVENLPMLFHLFRQFPDKRFVIIADYHREVMRRYLEVFADVKYQVVDAQGIGTASGLSQALKLIPEKEPFMLVWSDLILPKDLSLPEEYAQDDGEPAEDYVGVSKTFPCRWKYENQHFAEEASAEFGVAGFFLFSEKAKIADVPESGELVRWMSEKEMQFSEISLAGTREFGLIEEYEKLEQQKTRPFNRIEINGDRLTKYPVDAQGECLAKRECAWYEKAASLKIEGLPKIYGTSPLSMELIRGKNIYECHLEKAERTEILKKLIHTLETLHRMETVPADSFSMKEAYYTKTMNRIDRIENLVPFAKEREIRINGRTCRNVFYHREELEKKLEALTCEHFAFIHGDCTFSNLMLREDLSPVLIDPRGYFGFTTLYGDERYDWAKLYYSLVGNYDRFNLKDFSLEIGEEEVSLSVASNGWEDLEEVFFDLTGADRYEIKLLHAVIWLSLSTYAWQDYDSICGAFYRGLTYLEDVL